MVSLSTHTIGIPNARYSCWWGELMCDIEEPVCANRECKYHRYWVLSQLSYFEVRQYPQHPITIADKGGIPRNETYKKVTIKRILVHRDGRRIGMYCESCANKLIGNL